MSTRNESSCGDLEGFQGAFALMDVRGFGKITLESIFDFISACPNAPALDAVAKMYQDFDEDGSGDIDSGEFVGFCEELEKVTGYSAKEMIQFFEKKQYEHLFGLVDEDGGGTISVQELRVLVDALQAMLDLKRSAADVKLIMKEYDQDELEFEQFHSLMRKLTTGKSILQVVRAFEEAQRRSKQHLSNALMRFESMAVAPATPAPAKARQRAVTIVAGPCPKCRDKDMEILQLKNRVLELERQIEDQNKASRTKINIEPRVRAGLRKPEAAFAVSAIFPQAPDAVLHQIRSRRLVKIVERGAAVQQADLQEVARTFASLADSVHKAQRQIPPPLQPLCKSVQRLCEAKMNFLLNPQDEGAASLCRSQIALCKVDIAVVAEALRWAAEATIEARCTFADSALSIMHFSTNPRRFLAALDDFERVSQQLMDTATMASFLALDEPCEVELRTEEASEGKEINQLDVDRLIEDVRQDSVTFSDHSFAALTKGLKDTAYSLQMLPQSLGGIMKRDRGVGTAPLESILPAEPLKTIVPGTRHAPQSRQPTGLMSQPPRSRDIFVEKDSRASIVDALIRRYLASGVLVPSNFCRVYTVDVRDSHRHLFLFGSRRIELFVSHDALVVKVGGGFMYFEEFCETSTELEVQRCNRDFVRSPSPNPHHSAARSPSADDRAVGPCVASVAVDPSPQRHFSKRSESTRSAIADSRLQSRALSPKPQFASQ